MACPYLTDLLHQPEAVVGTVIAMRELRPLTGLANGVEAGRYRRVVFTGMGSSFHATHPVSLRLAAAGHWVLRIETSELNYYYPTLLASDTLLVVVSQSGASAETIRLLRVNAGRAAIVAVTNEPQSPLARAADATILTHAGPERTVSCKTYLATLVALAWLGDQLLPDATEPWLPQMEGAAQAVAAYLASWQQHVACLQHELRGVHQCYLVGRGPSLSTAGAGGLIIKEAARVPAEGLSAAGFRHGPFEMVSPDTYVLGFAGAAPTVALNARLISDVLQAGGRGALVGFEAEGPFQLPSVPEVALPLVEILPVQMMTVALASLNGLEPGQFRLASKTTTVE